MPKPLPLLATLAAASALATSAHAADDKAFLKKAIQGDNSEVALGNLAQAQAGSQGVKDFGAMLVQDHTAAKQKALPVAQSHGVANTQDMAPEAKAERRKLEGLHGQAFDREFARYMVKDHEKDIAEFEKQTRQGDAATQALAQDTLPDLRKHLQTAQSLNR